MYFIAILELFSSMNTPTYFVSSALTCRNFLGVSDKAREFEHTLLLYSIRINPVSFNLLSEQFPKSKIIRNFST